ncbi:MAG: 50S ribosomal protein L11 methyltransferase [Pseudomonadales bacterium]|nr:50S ribosomal protein L11 methyltransferase [Pseudomonadales bacterium]
MNWKTLGVSCTSAELEVLESLFWGTGAVSVTVIDAQDNPIFEPGPGEIPLWDNVTATGLYEDDSDIEAIKRQIKESGFKILFLEALGDRVWEREWLSRFKPMLFGERLWVCPTGYEVDVEGAVIMDLDPGLAFGTGTHATTKMCLEWLDQHVIAGMRVLDFGSGSGILGIAALLLGAESVLAVDNDSQALRASRDNAERNEVGERLQTSMPEAFESEKFDLVIANILAQPLIDLSNQLTSLLAPNGHLVLSGIMVAQSEWVKKAYSLNFVDEKILDGWVCLHGRTD